MYKNSSFGGMVYKQMENDLQRTIQSVSIMAEILDNYRDIFITFVTTNNGKQVTRNLSKQLWGLTDRNMGWFSCEDNSSSIASGEYLSFTEPSEDKKVKGKKYLYGGHYGIGTVILATTSKPKSDGTRYYFIDDIKLIKRYDEAIMRCRLVLSETTKRFIDLENYKESYDKWVKQKRYHDYMSDHYSKVYESLEDSFKGKDYHNLNYGLGRTKKWQRTQ